MLIRHSNFVKLLTRAKSAPLTDQTIADRGTMHSLLCLSCDSKKGHPDRARANQESGCPSTTSA